MALITESIVVRLRDPETGETRTEKIPLGEPWPFVDCEETAEAPEADKETGASRRSAKQKGDAKPKGSARAKGSGKTEGSEKPKAKAKSKRPKAPRRDLQNPRVHEALADEIVAAVEGGASRPGEIAKKVGVDSMQVVGVLKELADKGALVQEGRGRKARHSIPSEEAPAPEPSPASPPEELPAPEREPVRLRWSKEEIRGRETWAAPFEDGAFRIVPLQSGSHALFFEKGANIVLEYGCGENDALRARAKAIAGAGMPSPEAFRAAGGDVGQCPQPRRLRLDDVELTWRESVEGGRQVCVAATGDGEFKMLRSHGGSFILVFVHEGDAELDRLGCGSREELERRALDVLGQAETPEGDEGADASAATSGRGVSSGAEESEAPYEESEESDTEAGEGEDDDIVLDNEDQNKAITDSIEGVLRNFAQERGL